MKSVKENAFYVHSNTNETIYAFPCREKNGLPLVFGDVCIAVSTRHALSGAIFIQAISKYGFCEIEAYIFSKMFNEGVTQ